MHVTFPLKIAPECPFPLSNIPFGVFNTKNSPTKRVGTAIGDYILDVALLESHGLFTACSIPRYNSPLSSIFNQSILNGFAAMPAVKRSAVRKTIIALLSDKNSELFKDPMLNSEAFFKMQDAQMHLPMRVGDFSDFMCSRTHVDNCSKMAGGPGAPANFYAFPTAYNGRSSSILISGTSIRRPQGMLPAPSSTFTFAPSQRMDYELEMGIFISAPVPFGHTIQSADEAKKHIFGLVMLNDWSARDIQFAEMTPLGPFNGKGSATTISPWVVMIDALDGAEVETSDEVAKE
ncbi:hypothetical protein B0O99DRAFT_531291, partial [Bisporella sp. PMI_857]